MRCVLGCIGNKAREIAHLQSVHSLEDGLADRLELVEDRPGQEGSGVLLVLLAEHYQHVTVADVVHEQLDWPLVRVGCGLLGALARSRHTAGHAGTRSGEHHAAARQGCSHPDALRGAPAAARQSATFRRIHTSPASTTTTAANLAAAAELMAPFDEGADAPEARRDRRGKKSARGAQRRARVKARAEAEAAE